MIESLFPLPVDTRDLWMSIQWTNGRISVYIQSFLWQVYLHGLIPSMMGSILKTYNEHAVFLLQANFKPHLWFAKRSTLRSIIFLET